MDVVKVLNKGFETIVNGWIFKMMFNLQLFDNSMKKSILSHKLVDF